MVEAQQQQTSSSNPSIDAAPTLRKKPRATYGSRRRQPESGSEAEAEAAGNSSSTGRFSSPVSRLFDSSPQRPLSKHRAVTIADERDADEAAHRRRRSGESDRTGAADTSYTTTASSVHGDDDDEDHVLPEVGKARKLLDESDEESDDEPEDDEAFLARFRAQQTATQAPNATTEVGSPKGLAPARSSPSDLFSGSLSSAPPALAARSSQSDMFSGSLSSAPLTSSQDRLAGDEATDSSQLLVIPGLRQGRGSAPAPASSDSLEADGERQPSLERGSKQNSNQPSSDAEHQQKKAKAGRSTLAARMKSRKGRALLSSDSEQEHPSARDSASLSPTAALHRNRRACVVATVYSEDEDSDADLDEAARENRQEERTREKEAARKARMHSMAARARDRAGTSAYDANDVNALGTTEDVNHATDNGAASADSDGDSLPDVLAAARNAAQNAQAKNSRIAAEQAVRDRASAKVQGKRRKTLDLEESSAAGLDDGERRRKTTGSGTKVR